MLFQFSYFSDERAWVQALRFDLHQDQSSRLLNPALSIIQGYQKQSENYRLEANQRDLSLLEVASWP
jgi:hypothetical protein